MRPTHVMVSRLGAALCVFALCGLSSASAQDNLPTGLQPHRDYLSLQPFELIDTTTSNVLLTFSDLVLPGNGGRELRIERFFNNQAASGPRWSLSVNRLPLTVIEPPKPGPPGGLVDDVIQNQGWAPKLKMPDGSTRSMVLESQPNLLNTGTIDTSLRWARTPDFWRYDRDNHTLYLPNGLAAVYEVVDPLDVTVLQLVSFIDLFGNEVTLAWDPTELTITQPLGNSQTRVIEIERIEDTHMPTSMAYDGKTWTYTYESISGVTHPVLTEVELPSLGGTVRTWLFEYEEGAGSSLGMLTKISTPQGGEISYTYSTAEFPTYPGTAEAVVLDTRVVGGRDITAGTWDFDFILSGLNVVDLVAITLPSGNKVEYGYGWFGEDRTISGGYALSLRRVKNATGTTLEQEVRDYQTLPLVTYGTPKMNGVAPLSRTITRDSVQYLTTFTYSGSLTDFYNYHRPTQINEAGNAGFQRDTSIGYSHSPLIGAVSSTTVTENSVSRSNTWYRNSTTGFVTRHDAYGIRKDFTPDAFGNVATVTDANLDVTTYTYSWGVQKDAQMAEADMAITRTINADGSIDSETREIRTTSFDYDAWGRPTSVDPPGASNATTITYNDATGVTTSTRGSSVSTQKVDGFGRTIETVNPAGVKITTVLDAEGRVTRESYPYTNTLKETVVTYDALGRVVQLDSPGSVSRTFEYGQSSVTITDEAGRETVQTFTAFGNPDDARLVSITDADSKQWTYTYWPLDRLKSVTPPDSGPVRTWTYDAHDLLTQEEHPESGRTDYTYDAAGFLTQTSTRRGTFTYTRDDIGRVETISSSGTTWSFTYESGSYNRATASVGTVSTQFGYDTSGRLTSRIDTVGSQVFRTGYEYDDNDNLITVSYPSLSTTPRRKIGYDYNAAGQITHIFDRLVTRDYATNFSYHPSGALTGYTAGNNVPITYGYDANRYWIRSISAAGWTLTYDNYDAVGNVRELNDSRSGKSQTLAYDVLDRLIDAVGPYGQALFDYDAQGNRTNTLGTSYEYYPGTNRLKAINGAIRTYSLAGDLLTMPNQSFTYTKTGMMQTSSVFGTTTTYNYDIDDLRISETRGSNTIYRLRDPFGGLLTEWRNPGGTNELRDYVYAGSRLIAAIGAPIPTPTDPNGYGTAALDGQARTFTHTTFGQKIYITFDGTLGQRLVPIVNPSWSCVRATFKSPDDSTLIAGYNTCAWKYQEPTLLPSTGPYTLILEHIGGSVGPVSITLTDVVDVTGNITADGTPVSVSIQHVAQNARYYFTASASQRVSALSTHATCLAAPLAVKKEDNTTVGTTSSCATAFVEPVTLAAGNHYVLLDPNTNNTGSGTLKLFTVTDQTGSITVNGSTVPVSIDTPGQVMRLTFSATASQQVTVHVTSNAIGTTTVKLLKPDQTQAATNTSAAASFDLAAFTPPANGTYTILVDPGAEKIGNITISVTNP